MKVPETDFKYSSDSFEMEMNSIKPSMERFTVEFPDERKIDATIDTLRQYIPPKKGALKLFLGRIWLLMGRAAEEAAYISRAYWIGSIIIFLIGYAAAGRNIADTSPYLTVAALSPVPFFFGIVEIFRDREEGLLEIEMSCRISGAEVMLSRVFLIGIYSIVLNTVFSLILGITVYSINLWRLMLYWICPLTISAGSGLWLAIRIRRVYAAAVASSIWGVMLLIILSHDELKNWLAGLNITSYITIMILGIAIIFSQLMRILSGYSKFQGGGMFEIDN